MEKKIRQIREQLSEAVKRGTEKETRELNEEWKHLQTELSRLKLADHLPSWTKGDKTSGGEDK